MKRVHRTKGTIFVLCSVLSLSVLAPACGDDDDGGTDDNEGGAGGAGGSGAKAGSGGAKAGNGGRGGSAGAQGGSTPTGGTSGGTGSGIGGAGSGSVEAGSGGTTEGGSGGTGGTTDGGTGGTPEGGTGGLPEGGTGGVPEGGSAGEGGTGGSGPTCPTTPVVLYDFTANVTDWKGSVYKSDFSTIDGTATIVQSTTEGHTASPLGALQNTLVFGATGVNSTTSVALTPHADWTCFTRLRAWIKVAAASAADYDKMSAIQAYINTGPTNTFKGGGYTTFVTNMRDGNWREFVVDLPPEKTDVGSVGVLFQASAAVNATLYIDDITLE